MKEKYRDRAHGIEFSSQYQNPQQILKGLPNSQNVTSLSSSDISNKPHQNHVASPQSPYETDPRLSQVSHSVHTQNKSYPPWLRDPRLSHISHSVHTQNKSYPPWVSSSSYV